MSDLSLQTQIKGDFPVLSREIKGHRIAYLDNAATTLKPHAVVEAVEEHYEQETANIHRGVHELSEIATAKFEQSRETIRDFIHAADVREIIFTSGTTNALNLVAQSWGSFLQPGDEILLTQLEHHSNIVPWQMIAQRQGATIKVAPIDRSGALLLNETKALITPRTKIVATTYISNALGTIIPLQEIIKAAHAAGAVTVVDAAQAIAHMPINVQQLDCDFLAFSGHKIYGPTGIGVLYGKRALLEKMPPVFGGGGMIREVSFAKSTYADLPAKFEAGTPDIAGAIGLGAAIRYVQKVGWTFIHEQEEKLLKYATERLSAIPGLRIIGTAHEKATIISFVVDGIHPHDIGTLLDERGVAVRSGHHCAQPLMKFFGVPATTRASFAFYNSKEDVDALVDAILHAKKVFQL